VKEQVKIYRLFLNRSSTFTIFGTGSLHSLKLKPEYWEKFINLVF